MHYTSEKDLEEFQHIFLVMDFVEQDMKKILMTVPNGTLMDEDHIIVILYNLLCCMNFVHSANLIHRDLKPANILLDSSSQVLICDFGLSRSQPKYITLYNSIPYKRSKLSKKMLDYSLNHKSSKRLSNFEDFKS